MNPIPFNKQSYQKQKGPGTSDQSLCRLQNKFIKISLLVMYYLTKFDGVIQSSFGVFPKITPANLCKPIHGILKYSTSICLLKSVYLFKRMETWIYVWNIRNMHGNQCTNYVQSQQ